MAIYETQVMKIGPDAEDFREENMLILFGNEAPDTLADYCYNIIVNPTSEPIATGMTLYFDDTPYKITAVGDVVQKNLESLGHITVKFDGSISAELPGSLYVEAKEMPNISEGTKIKID